MAAALVFVVGVETKDRTFGEAELERSIAADPDWRDVPRDWYRGAEAVMPRPKIPVSVRLDADLVEFFRGQGGVGRPS